MNSVKTIKNNRKAAVNWVAQLSVDELPKIDDVAFIKDEIVFVLDDQRIIYIPISWSKKLQKANNLERMKFKNSGAFVFWDNLDEIIGIKNILFGKELFI